MGAICRFRRRSAGIPMANRWLCINGHAGTEQPAGAGCPVCGAYLASLVPAGMAAPEESYDTIMPDAPSRAPERGATLLPAALHPPPSPPAPPPEEAERTVMPAAPPGLTEMPNGRPTQPIAAGVHDTSTHMPGKPAAPAAPGN